MKRIMKSTRKYKWKNIYWIIYEIIVFLTPMYYSYCKTICFPPRVKIPLLMKIKCVMNNMTGLNLWVSFFFYRGNQLVNPIVIFVLLSGQLIIKGVVVERHLVIKDLRALELNPLLKKSKPLTGRPSTHKTGRCQSKHEAARTTQSLTLLFR